MANVNQEIQNQNQDAINKDFELNFTKFHEFNIKQKQMDKAF